jgi:hypothetical protein
MRSITFSPTMGILAEPLCWKEAPLGDSFLWKRLLKLCQTALGGESRTNCCHQCSGTVRPIRTVYHRLFSGSLNPQKLLHTLMHLCSARTVVSSLFPCMNYFMKKNSSVSEEDTQNKINIDIKRAPK